MTNTKPKYTIIEKNGKRYVRIGKKLIKIDEGISERQLIKFIINRLHKKRKQRKDNGLLKPKVSSSSSGLSNALLVSQVNRGNQESKDKIKDLEDKIKKGLPVPVPSLAPVVRPAILPVPSNSSSSSPAPAPQSNHNDLLTDINNNLVVFKKNGQINRIPMKDYDEMQNKYNSALASKELSKKQIEDAKKARDLESQKKRDQQNKVKVVQKQLSESEKNNRLLQITAINKDLQQRISEAEKVAEKQAKLDYVDQFPKYLLIKTEVKKYKIPYTGNPKEVELRKLLIDNVPDKYKSEEAIIKEAKEKAVNAQKQAVYYQSQIDEIKKLENEIAFTETPSKNLIEELDAIQNVSTPIKPSSKDESNSMYDSDIERLNAEIEQLGLKIMVKSSYKSKKEEVDEKQKLIDDVKQVGDGRPIYNKALSNFQIDDIMSKYGDLYLGTVAHDQIISDILPKVQPQSKGSFIVNLDNSNQSGSHWVAVYFDGTPNGSHSVEFYNSFGDNPDSVIMEGLKAISKKLETNGYLKFKTNKVCMQSDTTANCGFFSMQFIISRLQGKKWTESTNWDEKIKDESLKGEHAVELFKKQVGYGVFDFLDSFKDKAKDIYDRVKTAITGKRDNWPPNIRKLIGQHGSEKMTKITIVREPINSMIDKALNIISLGKWNESKSTLGYDTLFHLFMVIDFEGGEDGRLEKNHTVEMRKNDKKTYDDTITVNPGDITFGELMDNAFKKYGAELFKYSASDANCQAFIKSVLSASNLYSSETDKFVMQDAKTLIESLHPIAKTIVDTVTDVADRADALVKGAGNKRRKLKYKN